MSISHITQGYNPVKQNNNVNDNDILQSKIINDNVNDRTKKVDYIADKLVRDFNSPDSRDFYCLIAWKLPEAKIWLNYEKSQKGRSPAKLFNWLCRKDIP